MLGQPHNLVRHPDLPAEAFRDLWATLKAGEPWTALVKNRRKNGDPYWVRANVTPVLEAGQVTGYMSVRTVASRDEVAQAEPLYAQMREQAAAGAQRRHQGSGQVSATAAELDNLTQQNAAMVEELAAAASSLSGQAERVSQAVRIFKG